MKRSAAVLFCISTLSFTLLSGCGMAGGNVSSVQPNVAIKGSMHGGQQPVSGASIQLYAVGTADGSGATALLKTEVKSDANGGFSITNNFDCPMNDPLVYLVGTGGDPGMGHTNSAIGLMAALGHCSTLSASSFVQMNEVTTVAAAAALAPFMTPPANVGAADPNALASAFNLAAEYADPSQGTSPGLYYSGTPTSYQTSVPVATINTLANIIAACINTPSNTSTMCSQLASLTGGSADTLTAIVKVMQNPGAYDSSGLFALASPIGPFQPQLSSAPVATFGVSPQPPTTDSSLVFSFPSTVGRGDALWIVAKQYPPCIAAGGNNYLLLNNSVFATGGTAQCGQIYGIVPTNATYATQTAAWTVYNSALTQIIASYLAYTTVVPKPTPTYAFKPNAVFWEGDGVAHASYNFTVIFNNTTGANVTLGASSFVGPDAADFRISQTFCENAVVNSSGGCSVDLTFLPPDTGMHFATFVMPVTDQTGHVSYITVQLGGNGQYH